MKAKHSTAWLGSKQPRKQRKYRYNAPLHLKSSFLSAHVSKDLRMKHGLRSLRVRTGDKVRVLRGQFKAREGKVERVDVKKSKVFVNKVDTLKKDGATRVPYPLDASNLMIVEFDTTDKRRTEMLKARGAKTKAEEKKTK
jgi:large subunit ribosomal protein L24